VNVDEVMAQAAKTYKVRGQVYGDSYLRQGAVMAALMPGGVDLLNAREQARFSILSHIIEKLARYCTDFKSGHEDSIHDAGVYCLMLQAIDQSDDLR